MRGTRFPTPTNHASSTRSTVTFGVVGRTNDPLPPLLQLSKRPQSRPPTLLPHCPTRPKPQHPPLVNLRHKNATRALRNQPPERRMPPPGTTHRSGQDHHSSPTTTYTTVLLRLPPTSPLLPAVAATAKSPHHADATLSVVAATTVATTSNCDPHGACISASQTTCNGHHSQPPGHRVPLRCGFLAFFLASASCQRHYPTVATPLRLWCA